MPSTSTLTSPPKNSRPPFPANPADLGALFFPTCQTRDNQWEMSSAERALLRQLLDRVRPRLSVEVGTFRGGSLALISQFSNAVFSLDIDPGIPQRLKHIRNAQFIIGPSAQTLPELLAGLTVAQMEPEFFLIDADHSEQGVRGDIQTVLARTPLVRTFLLMHDSFNPGCRRGILTAGWEANPHVHFIETDFVTGSVVNQPGSPADGQLWGGLAFAILDPVPRTGALEVLQTGRRTFERCLGQR